MQSSLILDKKGMANIQAQLLSEILEKHPHGDFMLVGVQRRGADLARRFVLALEEKTGRKIELGLLDINLYRDDWTLLAGAAPSVEPSCMPLHVENKNIILVDDVLYSGRTIRAALEAIMAYGRPSRVELLAFIDRGHRELPIQADYVGMTLETGKEQRVDVLVDERDGEDAVRLY